MTRLRLYVGITALFTVVVMAALVAVGKTAENKETPLERDLATLRSSDGLYTAPQIRAQAGFSLAETAYSYAALRLLRNDKQLKKPGPEVLNALHSGDIDGEAQVLWYKSALADSGLGTAKPRQRDLVRVWRSIQTRDSEVALINYSALVDLSTEASLDWAQLSAKTKTNIDRLLQSTRWLKDPAFQALRLRISRFARHQPDDAIVSAGKTPTMSMTDLGHRAVSLAAVIEICHYLKLSPQRDIARDAVAAAKRVGTPASIYAVVRAFTLSKRELKPLQPLQEILLRKLSTSGAIPENAVFPVVGKALWLVTHIRKEIGARPLPEGQLAPLSQLMAKRVKESNPDLDEYSILLASAHLAGLNYSGPGVNTALPSLGKQVRNSREALLWSQRAQVAIDLNRGPAEVDIGSLPIESDLDLAAAGTVLSTARRGRVSVKYPQTWDEELPRRAGEITFRSVRWALQTAAGLTALGKSRAASDVLKRTVHIGCPQFPHLVRDVDGMCDLESTWLLLQMRGTVPVAKTLTRSML